MGRGLSQKSKDLMEEIYEVFQLEHPLGPRRVAYALFGNQAGKMASKVGNLCGRMLDDGRLPLDWYDDSSRSEVEPFVAETIDDVVAINRQAPPFDPWADQPVRVKVWSEKSVGQTLAPVLNELAVPFLNTRGFNGQKIMMEEARRTRVDPRRLVILAVGDHDASGLRMTEADLPKRFKKYDAVNYEIRRVAITSEDFHAMKDNGVVDPIKERDPNRKWYVQHTGDSVGVELETLPAPELRRRVREAIEETVVDWTAWARTLQASRAMRESWEAWVDQWPGADRSIQGLDPDYGEVEP